MTNRKVLTELELMDVYRKLYTKNPSAHPVEFGRAVEEAVQTKMIECLVKNQDFSSIPSVKNSMKSFIANPCDLETF